MVHLVDNLVERVLPRIRRRPLIAYPIAAGIFLICALLRIFLLNWLPMSMPFLTFYIAVLIATLVAGTGPGLLVIGASLLFAWQFYFDDAPQYNQFELVVALSAFSLMAILIVALVHLLNRKVESLLNERDRNESLLQDSALGELQLEQLNIELRHRLKNTFAVISGLVSQSARFSPDVQSFASALSGRLAAMGNAMDLVATRSFLGASVNELIVDTMKPLVPPGASRLTLNGPDEMVPGDVANALALTLHELGTNAIKYGAWSQQKGSVRVSWTFGRVDEDDSVFELVWDERGGPRVGQPTHKGLGSLLIDSGFPSAQVERKFTDDGVYCRITAVVRLATTRRTRSRRALQSS